jgi:hypothetical protein
MEHNYVIDKGIIENYLLHRLSETETDDFEEHLLYCKECRKLLTESKEMIALTQYVALHSANRDTKEDVTQKRFSFFTPFVKAVAMLFLIVCSAGITWYLLQKPMESYISSESNPNPDKNSPVSAPIDNTMGQNSLSQPVITGGKKSLSENYKEHVIYENAIKNNLRGENIEILSPAEASAIAFGKKVIFALKDNNRKILLSVIDNTGKSLFEDIVKTPYTLPLKLQKGLYYWEITDNDEVVFVSKFYIR